MLTTVTLVVCLLGGVASQQDLAIGKAAFQQLMVGCLGEVSYRDYLKSVVAASRECGGGVNEQGFNLPGLANTLLSPSARFPPEQGIPFSQPGAPGLQGPPGVSQRPGVFTPSGVFPQQSGVFPQQSGVFPQQSGRFPQQSGAFPQQPGRFPQQSGAFPQQSGAFPQQSGRFPQQSGAFPQQSGAFPQQSGAFPQQSGAFSSQPGIFPQQQQFNTQRPGAAVSQPGTFAQESGIFSQLDKRPVVKQVDIIDSVPAISSPIAPSFPGIRQKRQVALNLADIQRARQNMRGLVNNFTCVLSKLAVVNTNLDLNLRGLTNSVANLPVGRELKRDLLQAINYCSDSTQCLPLERMPLPVPHKLKRVMEYVKCEKEMRLKACHKHNLRQNLQNINLGRLSQDGSQSNTVEEIVNLLVDSQSTHELDLI